MELFFWINFMATLFSLCESCLVLGLAFNTEEVRYSPSTCSLLIVTPPRLQHRGGPLHVPLPSRAPLPPPHVPQKLVRLPSCVEHALHIAINCRKKQQNSRKKNDDEQNKPKESAAATKLRTAMNKNSEDAPVTDNMIGALGRGGVDLPQGGRKRN